VLSQTLRLKKVSIPFAFCLRSVLHGVCVGQPCGLHCVFVGFTWGCRSMYCPFTFCLVIRYHNLKCECKVHVRTLPGAVNSFSTITLTSDALLSLRRSTVLRGSAVSHARMRCSSMFKISQGPFSLHLAFSVRSPTVRLAFVLRRFSVYSPSVLHPFTIQRTRNANGTETFYDAYCTKAYRLHKWAQCLSPRMELT